MKKRGARDGKYNEKEKKKKKADFLFTHTHTTHTQHTREFFFPPLGCHEITPPPCASLHLRSFFHDLFKIYRELTFPPLAIMSDG